eukprot:UN34073
MIPDYHGPFDGVCVNGGGVSPPNYSKDGLNLDECKTECGIIELCIGYSYHVNMGRCAIWVDKTRAEMTDIDTWQLNSAHPSVWNAGVDYLTGGSG